MSNQFYRHFLMWRAKIHCVMGLEVRLASGDIQVAGVGHVKPVTITWRTLPGTYRYGVTRSVHLAYCLRLFLVEMKYKYRRTQWPCGLRRKSAATRLLGLWVLIPPKAWISVSCECLVSHIGLCDGPIPHLEESYRVCVSSVECEQAQQ